MGALDAILNFIHFIHSIMFRWPTQIYCGPLKTLCGPLGALWSTVRTTALGDTANSSVAAQFTY
jgi:hypothetical protein